MEHPLLEYRSLVDAGKQAAVSDNTYLPSITELPICCHEGGDCLYSDTWVSESLEPPTSTIISYEKETTQGVYERFLDFEHFYIDFKDSELTTITYDSKEYHLSLDLNKITTLKLLLREAKTNFPLMGIVTKASRPDLDTNTFPPFVGGQFINFEYNFEFSLEDKKISMHLYKEDELETVVKTYEWVYEELKPTMYEDIVTGTDSILGTLKPSSVLLPATFRPVFSGLLNSIPWPQSDIALQPDTWLVEDLAYPNHNAQWKTGEWIIKGQTYIGHYGQSDWVELIVDELEFKTTTFSNADITVLVRYTPTDPDDSWDAVYILDDFLKFEDYISNIDGLAIGSSTIPFDSYTWRGSNNPVAPSSIQWSIDGSYVPPTPTKVLSSADYDPLTFFNSRPTFLNVLIADLTLQGNVDSIYFSATIDDNINLELGDNIEPIIIGKCIYYTLIEEDSEVEENKDNVVIADVKLMFNTLYENTVYITITVGSYNFFSSSKNDITWSLGDTYILNNALTESSNNFSTTGTVTVTENS